MIIHEQLVTSIGFRDGFGETILALCIQLKQLLILSRCPDVQFTIFGSNTT